MPRSQALTALLQNALLEVTACYAGQLLDFVGGFKPQKEGTYLTTKEMNIFSTIFSTNLTDSFILSFLSSKKIKRPWLAGWVASAFSRGFIALWAK